MAETDLSGWERFFEELCSLIRNINRLMHALRMRKGALSTSASISKFLYQVAFGYSSRLQLFKSTSAIQVDFSYSLASRLRLFKSTSAIQGDFRYQKVSASRLGFPSRSFLLDCQSRREAKVVLLCLACHTHVSRRNN